MAAGVFAAGHLGELTPHVPFELADGVLEEARAQQRRLLVLPSWMGIMFFVLALGLFPGLGYGIVLQKLTVALDGLGLPCPCAKALRDLRRRITLGSARALPACAITIPAWVRLALARWKAARSARARQPPPPVRAARTARAANATAAPFICRPTISTMRYRRARPPPA